MRDQKGRQGVVLAQQAREFGVSILASAGIAGLVIGFAAQRSIATLLAGVHIAFTQRMRLGDAILIEGEFGNVEEITLSYVVIKLWENDG